MIPAHYSPSIYSFMVNNGPPIRVLLVSDALAAQATTKYTEPFWYMEVGNRQTLDAVLRWLRVRRSLWKGWGELAEKKGRPALARHINKLMKAEPPAEVVSFVLDVESDKSEVALGELLATKSGLKKQIYHRHSFQSSALCAAFRNWLLNNNPEENGKALLEVALNSGTAELSEIINKIASDEHNSVLKAV